ncbi:MAG: hypothetical protein A3F13_03845 [Gammaproteobacteria bacterium RIFCSPHIGHO2_12_FULL_40_19]|nr:MAG: hypothetical protein A3F13_03845 [Gammaproteobacteria bacterium RIFCSPHIGHO2_12_FULL_40_19]
MSRTLLSTPRLKSSTGASFITDGESTAQYHNIEVEIGKKLGAGKQGTVFYATLFFEKDKQEQIYYCAAKRIKTKNEGEIPQEMLIHADMSDAINLPSADSALLRQIGIYQTEKGETYALLPLCDATLTTTMETIKGLARINDRLYNQAMFDFFSSMVDGLSHLSALGLAHGDLKPDNIVLRRKTTAIGAHATIDSYRHCMLDFGSVVKLTDESTDGLKGTPLYLSPDLIVNCKASFESDVWAVGAILRQFSGEDISEKIDEPMPLIHKRGKDFIAAKDAAQTQSTMNHQAILQKAIAAYPSFSEGLAHMTKVMSETLPEKRPSIQTLQLARDKLKSLLPILNPRETSKLNNYLATQCPAAVTSPAQSISNDSFGSNSDSETDDDQEEGIVLSAIHAQTRPPAEIPPLALVLSPVSAVVGVPEPEPKTVSAGRRTPPSPHFFSLVKGSPGGMTVATVTNKTLIPS